MEERGRVEGVRKNHISTFEVGGSGLNCPSKTEVDPTRYTIEDRNTSIIGEPYTNQGYVFETRVV